MYCVLTKSERKIRLVGKFRLQKKTNKQINFCKKINQLILLFRVVEWDFPGFSDMKGQGPTLRLTGRQCDQKLSVGDQKFRTGRQQATNLLSPRHLEFQGKWAFLKENIKLPWRIVVKQSDDFAIAIITRRHIVSAASRYSDIAGENVTWQKS